MAVGSYRLKERFEGIRWMGVLETPREDVAWLESLPGGNSNVTDVHHNGDSVEIGTRLSVTEANVGDYILIGDNGQPLVMPKRVFDMRYELDDEERRQS